MSWNLLNSYEAASHTAGYNRTARIQDSSGTIKTWSEHDARVAAEKGRLDQEDLRNVLTEAFGSLPQLKQSSLPARPVATAHLLFRYR